jgi:putative YhbY family RNA-binding protein
MHLKGRAHALEPIVQIGHEGLTDRVLAEIDRGLVAHELIKVRANAPDRETRAAWLAEICAKTEATAVQQVGKVLVLWRARPIEDATS